MGSSGITTTENRMGRLSFVVVATLLAFAVSEIIETEVEESYSPEQAHADAQHAIDALIQLGRKDSACRSLSHTTKKEIKDGQRNTQRLINRMDVGKTCHKAGLSAYNAAKSHETRARNAYNSATKACNKAKGARVQVGRKSLSQFTVGCAAFLNDAKYVAAKRHMTNTCNDAIKKKAAYENSKKATATAHKAHLKSKAKCACRAQKNHKAAVAARNKFNSAANAKAWTKAHHMLCVLDGKSANRCSVPRVPKCHAPSMPNWVARTKCSSPSPPAPKRPPPPPPPAPPASKFGLIKNKHGICLDASQRNKRGGKVHMWSCNTGNYNQQWKYTASTGQIKNVHGKCLDASQRNKQGGKVHMWSCNTGNWNQQWQYSGTASLTTVDFVGASDEEKKDITVSDMDDKQDSSDMDDVEDSSDMDEDSSDTDDVEDSSDMDDVEDSSDMDNKQDSSDMDASNMDDKQDPRNDSSGTFVQRIL